jgi:hypothetical protein
LGGHNPKLFWILVASIAKTEFGFYGIEKNNARISETEMNIRIAEALAGTNDDDDECDILSNESYPIKLQFLQIIVLS